MQTTIDWDAKIPRKEMMQKFCDANENPYVDWPSYAHSPWQFLERYNKCYMWKRGNMYYERNKLIQPHPKRNSASFWWDFKELEMDIMVSEFFTEKTGKPRFHRLAQNVDKWLVWAVTQGFYRMDKFKNIYVFKGVNPTILDLHDSKGWWDNASSPQDNFPILRDITDAVNRLYAAVLCRLSRIEPRTKSLTCLLQNLINLPEFVMFQSYRGHDHKQFLWRYQPGPKRGSKTPTAAKPVRIPKHSVHWILMNYHLWLPQIKDVTKN